MRWLDSTTYSVVTDFSKLQVIVEDRGVWASAVCGVAKSWIRLSKLTATTNKFIPTLVVLCCVKFLQLCLTLYDPMDYSLPGSSVYRILQARILEWVAMSSSKQQQATNLFEKSKINSKNLLKLFFPLGQWTNTHILKTCSISFSYYVCTLAGSIFHLWPNGNAIPSK